MCDDMTMCKIHDNNVDNKSVTLFFENTPFGERCQTFNRRSKGIEEAPSSSLTLLSVTREKVVKVDNHSVLSIGTHPNSHVNSS